MSIGAIFAGGVGRASKRAAAVAALAALGSAPAAAQTAAPVASNCCTYSGSVVTVRFTRVVAANDSSVTAAAFSLARPGTAAVTGTSLSFSGTAVMITFGTNVITGSPTLTYRKPANSSDQLFDNATNARVDGFTRTVVAAGGATPALTVNLKSIAVDAADGAGVVAEGVSTMVTATLERALPAGGRATVNLALTDGRTTGAAALAANGPTGQAEADDILLGTDGTAPSGFQAVINIAGGMSSGSVPAVFQNDADAVDEGFRITATLASVGGVTGLGLGTATTKSTPATSKIDDDEVQTWVMNFTTPAADRKEGGPKIEGTVTPSPALPMNEASGMIWAQAPRGYAIDGGSGGDAGAWRSGVEFKGGGSATPVKTSQALNIAAAVDGNRTDDEVVIQLLGGSVTAPKVLASKTITVLDTTRLPTMIGADAKDKKAGGMTVGAVEEGGTVYLDVWYVNSASDRVSDTEKFMIEATVAETGRADVRLTGGAACPAGAPAGAVCLAGVAGPGSGSAARKAAGQLTLMALKDEDVGAEKVAINLKLTGEKARGPGDETGTFEIEIADATARQVSPKAEAALRAAVAEAMPAPFNPGACFDLMGGALFDLTDGFTAAYSAMASSPAFTVTVSGGTVTVCAVSAGSGTVTVTATVNSSSVTSSQTASNVARVTFDVDVVAEALSVTVAAEPAAIMEGGAATITATANRAVTADRRIALSVAGDADAYEVADAITIERGMKTGSVTLTAREDADAMDETLTVVATGPGIAGAQRLAITVSDNDAPARTIRAKATAADMIAAAIVRASGTGDWMVGGPAATVDMGTLFDADAGADAVYSGRSSDGDIVRAANAGNQLTLTPTGAGAAVVTVTGTDTASGDVATVTAEAAVALQTLSVTVTADAATVREGASVTLTAEANRAVAADTEVMLTVTGDAAAVEAPGSITIAAGMDAGTAMLTAAEDDSDAADARVTVVASGPGISGTVSILIDVIDNDATVQAKPQAEVDAVFVTATATAGGSAGWQEGGGDAAVDMSALFTTLGSPTVTYRAESSDVATVLASASGSALTLKPMQEGAATITVTAVDTSGDADDTATAMSEVTVGVLPLEVALMPATAEAAEGGAGVTITATANKMVGANVEVMLVHDVASTAGMDDYALDPPLITIMAGRNSGSLVLTAVDDRAVEGMEKLTLHGQAGDLDAGSVAVTIEDNDMALRYELSAAETNLAEGRSARLTATACAAEPADSCLATAAPADTEVQIVRDGSSTASAADYEAGPITIMAGETSGYTRVTAVEDGEPDSGSGSPEMLTLYGMVGGARTNGVSFHLWDAAVPALPVVAQLLLAALLAAGGVRRWRRR